MSETLVEQLRKIRLSQVHQVGETPQYFVVDKSKEIIQLLEEWRGKYNLIDEAISGNRTIPEEFDRLIDQKFSGWRLLVPTYVYETDKKSTEELMQIIGGDFDDNVGNLIINPVSGGLLAYLSYRTSKVYDKNFPTNRRRFITDLGLMLLTMSMAFSIAGAAVPIHRQEVLSTLRRNAVEVQNTIDWYV